MRRPILLAVLLLMPALAVAGFKAKKIKPKQPERFQVRMVVEGITVASDLLLSDSEQKEFFYKELNTSNIIPLRLAIFNNSQGEILIPSEGIRLFGPDGKELQAVSPEAVAQAVMHGPSVLPGKGGPPVQVGAGPGVADPRYDPRYDPRDPRNDPRIDPTDPRYDPQLDPRDPRYDPSDPRNRGYGNRRIGPGVDIVLNPPGTGGGDYDDITRRLIEKDFSDKAYLADPVMPKMRRDRFLYFQMDRRPVGVKGFVLQLPEGRDLPQGVKLAF